MHTLGLVHITHQTIHVIHKWISFAVRESSAYQFWTQVEGLESDLISGITAAAYIN